MVSLKDIAKACGVSIATVSKALNGYKDVGAEKREEISRVAKELGYLPNSSARALKTNRTYNLGILFSDEARSGLTHDYFNSILESFKVTAESKGYDITFTSCNQVAGRKMSYLEHSLYRGLDGVVIACIDFEKEETQELIRGNLPIVTIDYVYDDRISVVSDNKTGMTELVKFVCNNGHRKVAYVHGDNTSVTRTRLSCFYRVMAEYGVDVPDEYIKEGSYRNVDVAAKLTRELLDLDEPPTCIMYSDDLAAMGGMNVIRERGLSVPNDISIVGYDGNRLAEIVDPKLTTMKQDTTTIGRVAAEELIHLIEQPKLTLIESIIVPGILMPGGSVKNLNSDL